jgi:hypothetical protein
MRTRKKVTVAVAAALVSAMCGSANAAAAVPTGTQTADQIVEHLSSQGYHVILSRIGTAPLADCTVSALRPGHTYSRTDSGAPGAGDDIVTTVSDMTVYVDVNCNSGM